MKQLDRFLKMMRDIGFSCAMNWEEKRGDRTILCYDITSSIGAATVMFYTYGESDGFQCFVETVGSQMNDCALEINRTIVSHKYDRHTAETHLQWVMDKLNSDWQTFDAGVIRLELKERTKRTLKTYRSEILKN